MSFKEYNWMQGDLTTVLWNVLWGTQNASFGTFICKSVSSYPYISYYLEI